MKTPARKRFNAIIITALILFSGAFFSLPKAEAAPLNLWLGLPDIFSSYSTTTYDKDSHVFTSSGMASNLTMDGIGQPYITNSDGSDFMWPDSFRINASIDNNGVAHGGQLQITGYVVQQGFNTDTGETVNQPLTSGTLLTGNLIKFGWLEMDNAYAMFEFVFQVTGGDLMPYYNGKPAGVILSLGDFGDYASNPLFASSFAMDSGTMVSDTAPVVPIPGAVWLLGSGLTSLAGLKKRLNRRCAYA
ncbi:MAG: hypothetical protein A4E64_00199 [Syntrophorhabdus sp. PtaU1.Bin058]|nr:MAG: hypothetical protein A4E64_00199 [Syntrophorhabdus sp. PtaU1.Bin058]